MAKLTTPEFLNYLTQSELVAERYLRRSLDDLREMCGGELPDDAETVANSLIGAGLITRWHADKIFDKKYKGFRLGKYKLLKLLGSGEMSSVYLAEHVLMKQLRAIKVLPKSRSFRSPTDLQLFHSEAQATARIDHPNLVRAFDVDNDGEQHFFVMEYVDGKTLQSMVDDGGPLPFDVACNFIAQAAEGLGYAHEQGVIHCDVKPTNIMVDQQGLVRVLDLGLALHANTRRETLAATYGKEILTTAVYLSPEQAVDCQNVDLRTDIYNLGCTLHFLLTGNPPDSLYISYNSTPSNLAGVPLRQESLLYLGPHESPLCPPDLTAICLKMLEKKPDLRFQTMGEVVDALESCLHNHGYDFDPGPGVIAKKAPALKRSKISERILKSRPKRSQAGSSPTFPSFPLPGRGISIGRVLLVCVVGGLLIATVAMLSVWLCFG